ncbi:MAG: type I glyceraldehyde-3-phosphate dehydrogenase [Patescibacteria group bacterium]|nr:type I glyceraldehyde-3-phosphate dehydrogenase [Patescibacteria group bacterium]
MKKRIAINGFGRIGRAAFCIALNKKNIEVVAINDLTDSATLAHLLKYDSTHGKIENKVSSNKNGIVVDGITYPVYAEKDPTLLPWKELKIDVVLECTGIFRTYEDAQKHIKAGAKKVIISAPSKGENVETIVLGVNDEKIKKSTNVYDLASCTTNCIAPVMKIISDNFEVEKALMTTIHAYTADQNLVDGPHSDLRRARAAATNIVPTSTGAAIAVTNAIPKLRGKFDGIAVRVPVIDGSLSDITIKIKENTSIEKINDLFVKMSKDKKFKGILTTTTDKIVSSDIIGNPYSSIVDLSLTNVMNNNLIKIIAWYDNEWGFSNRMIELCEKI